MDPAVGLLVEALHQAAGKCALVVTGGGVQAVADLLSVPGASRTILEVAVPYEEGATEAYLGARPDSYYTVRTAEALATRAFERAAWRAPQVAVLGLGCTASLATDRPKRGEHHAHLACRTPTHMRTWSLVFQKGARRRQAEDEIVSRLVLNGLAWGQGLATRLELELQAGEQLETREAGLDLLARFLQGNLPVLAASLDGQLQERIPERPALLPGAFNPVHEGHWGLAAAAARRLKRPVLFELSVRNVDKPPLTPAEVRGRLGQFTWRGPMLLTTAPTFLEKAAIVPGAVFVIGADTAVRLVAPRYYRGDGAAMLDALACIREQGCRFLVACRTDEQGNLCRLADVAIPVPFRDLFEEVPPEEFLERVSSTAIRQGTETFEG